MGREELLELLKLLLVAAEWGLVVCDEEALEEVESQGLIISAVARGMGGKFRVMECCWGGATLGFVVLAVAAVAVILIGL